MQCKGLTKKNERCSKEGNPDFCHLHKIQNEGGKKQSLDRITIERNQVENILGQRFSFFVTFFTIIIGGAVASLGINLFISAVILLVGLILLLFLKLPIKSCLMRLNIMMELIYFIDKEQEHPTTIFRGIIKYTKNPIDSEENEFYKNYINNIPKERKYIIKQAKNFKSGRHLLGLTIPNLCLIIIAILFICNLISIILWLMLGIKVI